MEVMINSKPMYSYNGEKAAIVRPRANVLDYIIEEFTMFAAIFLIVCIECWVADWWLLWWLI